MSSASNNTQATTPSLPPVGFIGGGNMCSAIVGGLIAKKIYKPDDIHILDVSPQQLDLLHQKYHVQTYTDMAQLLSNASIIFIAVKPNVVSKLFTEHGHLFHKDKHIIISVCAGVTCATLEGYFLEPSSGASVSSQQQEKKEMSVIRVMPNTPALVGYGASGVCIGRYTKPIHLDYATTIMSAVGIVKVVPEQSMDAITGLSGSGPAYVFTMIESLTMGGVLSGLAYNDAKDLAIQTILGGCHMVMETGQHPAVLRDQVTSAGGTTIHGLYALEQGNLKSTIMTGVFNATKRAKELAEETKQVDSKL